jgi:sulfate permease, SulP family
LFQALKPFRLESLMRDVSAGVTLAAMDIPQVLGYTKIAGTPIVTGLYALLLPLVAFAAFGSSRYLVVSADSATAAILSGGLMRLAPIGSAHYVALASAVALLTAVFLLLARFLKLGFVADFLAQTVLVGFLIGVGFQVGIAVLGDMLGITVESHRSITQLMQVLSKIVRVHLPTLLVSVLVISAIVLLQRFAPKVPAAILVVVGSIVTSRLADFAGHGIAILGPVAGSLPRFIIPSITLNELASLIPIAGACGIMIITQSAATARFYASRHQQQIDENGDLMGLAAANAAAGLTGTFVVNGSPTQTTIVESAGSQSQVAQLATALAVGLVLIFLTGPLQYLPRCVLASLVFLIALRLIQWRSLLSIRKESPREFLLAAFTAIVVLSAGVEQGIVIAMVLSLLRIVQQSYHPHTGIMSLSADSTWQLSAIDAHQATEPGLVLYRFGATLFYANANRFAEEISCIVGTAPSNVEWLIVDAEAITHLDYSAARVVLEVHKNLAKRGVQFGFARMPWDLRSDFARHHVTEALDSSLIFARLHQALAAFKERGKIGNA